MKTITNYIDELKAKYGSDACGIERWKHCQNSEKAFRSRRALQALILDRQAVYEVN